MQTLRGTVRDLTSEGFGVVALPDGPVVLLPFVIEEEEVSFVIARQRKQVRYGQPIQIHKASPHRVAPECSVFGLCGGCRWQMMEYLHQLAVKRRFVVAQLEHIGGVQVEVPPVCPAPSPWHYRNKVEYSFGVGPSGKVVIGFHPRGDFRRVIPIEVCRLVPPAFEAARRLVEARAQAMGYPPYDPQRHTGLWRELLIRGTPEAYVALVSLAEDRPDLAKALLSPLKEQPACQGAGYFYNPKRNNSLYDLEPHLLWGKLEILYQVGGRIYEVGPLDFFQVNLAQAEALLRWLQERLPATSVLYDLYGGVGFLGIGVAERANRLILIEKLPQAVESAQRNFIRNQQFYPQTTFEGVAGSVEKVWSILPAPPPESVAIVDPPREGLHPALLKVLRKGPFAHLFYVSCHPATQARDIAALREMYEVQAVQPFDMFPHTTGMENVIWLKRRAEVQGA